MTWNFACRGFRGLLCSFGQVKEGHVTSIEAKPVLASKCDESRSIIHLFKILQNNLIPFLFETNFISKHLSVYKLFDWQTHQDFFSPKFLIIISTPKITPPKTQNLIVTYFVTFSWHFVSKISSDSSWQLTSWVLTQTWKNTYNEWSSA